MIEFGELVQSEETFYKNESIKIKVGERDYLEGKLYLSSNNISLKLANQQNAVIIPWESITVQAITQDAPRRVYFMLDVSINLFRDEPEARVQVNANHQNGNEENADEPMNGHDNPEEADAEDRDEGNETDDSEDKITEFWLLPDKPEEVDEIYNLMTKYPVNTGQNNDQDSEEEEEEEFFDGDDMANMNIEDNDQFADALE